MQILAFFQSREEDEKERGKETLCGVPTKTESATIQYIFIF